MKKLLFVASTVFTLSVALPNFSQAQVEVKHKERTGMDHKKKDALIGAGAGAVTGAVVSHDKSKGAIIGGVIGAGAGYLHGRHKDRQYPHRKRIYKTKRVYHHHG